jgi:AraC-like DNA-binding protein
LHVVAVPIATRDSRLPVGRQAAILAVVPSFDTRQIATTGEVIAIRAVCDGCDPARPCDEHAKSAWLWTVTAGAFEFRDTNGRHVLDPTRAVIMPAGHEFVIRHPAGPDTCVSYRGPIVDKLAASGPRIVDVSPGWSAAIARELANRRHGQSDDLALAEHVATIEDLASASHAGRDLAGATASRADRHLATASRADRDLVAAIEHVLRLDLGRETALDDLAERAGYSLFHACRVFRATTGSTIHGFRRELRLRHALARILDGDEPLASISDACGFASQSHLTNLFRARFGITPARARA